MRKLLLAGIVACGFLGSCTQADTTVSQAISLVQSQCGLIVTGAQVLSLVNNGAGLTAQMIASAICSAGRRLGGARNGTLVVNVRGNRFAVSVQR